MPSDERDRWRRLGQEVAARRAELQLTQEEAARIGGKISVATWRQIENGEKTSYRQTTLRALELALRWPRGAVEDVLDGHHPGAETEGLYLEQVLKLEAIEDDLALLAEVTEAAGAWTPEQIAEAERLNQEKARVRVFMAHLEGEMSVRTLPRHSEPADEPDPTLAALDADPDLSDDDRQTVIALVKRLKGR